MKFTEVLKNSKVVEWENKYVRYDSLKLLCYQLEALERQMQQPHSKEQEYVIKLQMMDIDDELWREIVKDFDVITVFFKAELTKLQKFIQDIELQCQIIKNLKSAQAKQLRENMQEVYKTLKLLSTYAQNNTTALRNIMKKRDRALTLPLADARLTTLFDGNRVTVDEPTAHELRRLERAYQQLERVDETAARLFLQNYVAPAIDAEHARVKAATGNGFVSGLALLLFANFLSVYFHSVISYQNTAVTDIYSIEMKVLRVQFCITLLAIFLGLDTFIFEKRKMNYIFILELPPSKIIASYRTHLKLCMGYLAILSLCATLCVARMYLDQDRITELPDMTFRDILYTVASWCPVLVWLFLPLLFPLAYLIRILINWKTNHSLVGKFVLDIIYKQFLPWKFRVSFPVFYVGDQLTSITPLFSDIAEIITWGHSPDWLIFIFVNIPAIIRTIQCWVRYKEKFLVYPHIVNLLKYGSSYGGTLINLNFVKASPAWTWVAVSCRFSELIYKLYWDFAEDWALFTGGTGVKQFKNSPNKWQHRIVCRRPSFFPTKVLLSACLFNFVGRSVWTIGQFSTLAVVKTFWYKTFALMVEAARRALWNLLRVDNQQATNCEDYALTRYIPVLLSTQERQALKQKEDELEAQKAEKVEERRMTMTQQRPSIVKGRKMSGGDNTSLLGVDTEGIAMKSIKTEERILPTQQNKEGSDLI